MSKIQILATLLSLSLPFAFVACSDDEVEEVKDLSAPSGSINGHDYIDLGLSVKWATCNLGASSSSDYGDYYAWGETATKSSYDADNSATYGKGMDSIAEDPEYDAATANWGGAWRLPTQEEIDELIDKCEHEWAIMDGHEGCKVTGPNGNFIFLPAAGYRDGTSLNNAEKYGGYWSATPNEDRSGYAYVFAFDSGGFYKVWDGRSHGQSVRPVTD